MLELLVHTLTLELKLVENLWLNKVNKLGNVQLGVKSDLTRPDISALTLTHRSRNEELFT